ncbi:MAG TPA: N-acetylmuramoyl-L-alanine amidase [Candidatus Acidoferrales bacterium]|nr:N-acetylmuramoyl-L-alanine amidase [Candidatus Acidoferrales bacterium]
MSRFRVRAGKSAALALLWFCSAFAAAPVRAQSNVTVPAFWFAGTQLIFEHPDRVDSEIAVRGSDPGLQRFLARVGATLSWEPGSRYVVVTTADRRTLTFTLGVPHFQTSSGGESVPLRAYVDGSDVYLPFLTLARALYVEPIFEGSEYVLQPQIGALNVRTEGRRTVVSLIGGTSLRFTKDIDEPGRMTLVFRGVSSTLQPSRAVDLPGLGRIDITVAGNTRNPTTVVTFETTPGAARVLMPSANRNELDFAFGAQDVAQAGVPVPAQGVSPMYRGAAVAIAPPVSPLAPAVSATSEAIPTAVPTAVSTPYAAPLETPLSASSPVTPTAAAVVTGLDVENPSPDALLIHIATSPGLSFEWHRLGIDRFYIDFPNATLTSAPRDDRPAVAFVQGYRLNQLQTAAVPTVRFAMTMTPNRRLDVIPDAQGLTITVADVDATGDFIAQVGSGITGGAANVAVVPTATPSDVTVPPGAIPPPGSNPRLIVIDPGHGGSDTGAVHNGVTEKVVTLDIALRLRTLLIARGWTVRMTRDTDRDVYGWDASDVNELQARVDVGNNSGARMFICIHANSSTSSVPSGTTSYYYKPQDRPLAAAIQARLVALLGTKDDGVVRERFYVLRRTTMPATLIETAFVSNPGDAARLRTESFRQQIAVGIADGIKDYAGQPSSSVSVQQGSF